MKRSITLVCAALLCAAQIPAPSHAAGLQDLQQFSDAFAELAAKVNPAVVAIKTERKVEHAQQNTPFDEFFREHPGFRRPQPEGDDIQEGLGSGVIVSKDGYILTNNHVITSGRRGDDTVADRIVVEMADLRSFEAEVVGRDPKTDLAVLKIVDGDDLPFLPFGNADELDVGEWVVAIGNPFGQLHTVTTGIISALGRGAGLSEYEDYIQTDAAINPGNSGGALVNTAGELIGINTAIVSRSGGYQGIGFAIPIDPVDNAISVIVVWGRDGCVWSRLRGAYVVLWNVVFEARDLDGTDMIEPKVCSPERTGWREGVLGAGPGMRFLCCLLTRLLSSSHRGDIRTISTCRTGRETSGRRSIACATEE